MAADGNLISKGQGEGAAIMIQPFLPDQTPFNQMNQILAQKQQQKAAQAAKQKADEQDRRDAWLKRLAGSGKYHPNDEKGIYKLQQKLVSQIEGYQAGQPKSEIENSLIALEYLTNNSKSLLDEDNRIQHDRLVNADKVWYRGIDEWEKANAIENDADTAEELIKNMAKRSAAQKMVVQGGEKITNPFKYVDGIIAKAQIGDAYTVASKDNQGQTITKTIRDTDRKLLDETLDFEIANNPEVLRVFGSPQEFKNQVYARTKHDEKVTIKGAQNNSNYNSSNGRGNSIVIGDAIFNPPTTETFVNEKEQKAHFERVKDGMVKALPKLPEKEQEATKRLLRTMDFEEWKKENPYKENIDAYQFSIKGNAENSPRLFTVETKDGSIKQVKGTSNIFLKQKDAFRVQDEKGNTYNAPVKSNMAYITDVMASNEASFKKGLGIADKGNVVTTDKKGNVTGVVKDTKGKQVYPQTKEEWDKAPKGSFYITKSGKKITK